MARDILAVDGIPAETKERLQNEALRLYGHANASMMVRALITAHFAKSAAQLPPAAPLTKDEASDRERVELRLPRSALAKIDAAAEAKFSKRNYHLVSIILASLGQPQLPPDQIEVLRRSNYELSKVGTNLNQIAKAFNILVNGGTGKMPEIGKKVASLRREITAHIGKVLRVLEAGTVLHETIGRGQHRPNKRKEKTK